MIYPPFQNGRRRSLLPTACLAVTFLAGNFSVVRAQTWSSTSIYASAEWSTGSHWSGGVAPTNNGTANVIFSQTDATNVAILDANWNVASVTFNSTPGLGHGYYTNPSIGNPGNGLRTLSIQAGGITSASPYEITINPSLLVAQAQTWDTGSGSLVVNNVSGAATLTKTGTGKLTFASAQSAFMGGLSVEGGNVVARNGSGLGQDGSPVTLRNGARLSFYTPINLATPYIISVNHPLVMGTGGGTITTFDGNTTFNQAISGPGALTLAQDANFSSSTPSSYTLSLANTYAGGTLIGNGVTVIAAGSQQVFGTGNVSVQSGGVLLLGSASNLALSSRVSLRDGTGDQAPSILVLSDSSLAPSSLVAADSTGGAVGWKGFTWTTPLDFSKIGNGKQSLGAGDKGAVYGATFLAPGPDNIYRLGGGVSGGSLLINGADNVLTGARSVAINLSGGYSNSPATTASNTFTSVGLTRANNYTGGTSLYAGGLALGNEGALGSGPLNLLGGGLQTARGVRTVANPIFLRSVTLSATDDLTLTGTVDLGGGTSTIAAGGGKVTFANVISNGALNFNGGNITLGAANTFKGLTISSGIVSVSSAANLGDAAGSVNILGGALSSTAPSLTINQPITSNYSQSTILTTGGVLTLAGPVNVTNTDTSLTKNGPGTLILTNPNSSGTLSVIQGTLQVDNVSNGKASGSLNVQVSEGGTLKGVATLGYVSTNGGHVAPGDQGPGTLTLTRGLYLYKANLDFDLGTQGSDTIVFQGISFQTSGNPPIVFNFADAGGLAPGQTYKLIDFGTADTRGLTASVFQLGTSPVGGTFGLDNNRLYFTTVAYTPYQQWQVAYFGSINNASATPNANPAGDGVSNLLKYALGLDPRVSTVGGLPKVGRSGGDLTLTYTRPRSVGGITYQPQVSDDLANWSGNGITQEVVSDDGAVQTVRTRVAAGAGRRFLRLNVSTP